MAFEKYLDAMYRSGVEGVLKEPEPENEEPNEIDPMKNWFFTFGADHITKAGVNMANYWVTVKAPGYWEARNIFVEKFTKVYMEAPDKFAFQYSENHFNESKCLFRGGEYKKIPYEKMD